jgi:hypothetical protein
MSRLTLKSSTIFISIGERTEVYRSVEDVPPGLRKKLEQSTNGINSATILIADRRGREEIVRAIRGLPSNLRSRLSATLRSEAQSPTKRRNMPLVYLRRSAEFLIPPALGIAVWLLFSWK